MRSRTLKSSLVWRLTGVLLLILVVLGLVNMIITTSSARSYYKETTQRLHSHVAEHMLLEVEPFIDGEVNEEALGKIMHSMMAVNPNLEVYLLSPEGEILSFVVLEHEVKLNRVEMDPVFDFIQAGDDRPLIVGDDPRNPGEQTIFSAAPVEVDGELAGYVYMVLASEQYESMTDALFSSYFIKSGIGTFSIALLVALGIGALLIYWLTRQLRIIIQTFKDFETGDLQARIPVAKNDELAVVGRTFNNMADTILQNMEELKQVDALRRELIANVSHDIRSPMAVIHGYLETLQIKNNELSEEERLKYLEIALKSSDKLKKLVDNLFELSKLESNQVEMQRQALAINEHLVSTTEEYALLAQKKDIQLKYNVPQSLPLVHADIDMMQRVIQNLMDNAIKYTPKNGSIEVEAKKASQGIEISIKNTGTKIPSEQLEHLFDRYYQTEMKPSQGGAGLGLAIVKKILDVHKSVIHVDSDDQWTDFRFVLPIQ